MSTLVTCPDCGLDYQPQQALKQLCPGCLYREAAADDAPQVVEKLRSLAEQARFQPPKINDLQPCFPQIEIIELLGHGGMSAVYKARQTSVDRVVALKILPLEIAEAAGGIERFQRETQTLASLSHPNIVTIHDASQAGPWCYCIMEFVSGPNLRQLLGESRLAASEILRLAPDVCDGLQYAHDQGVVHRDIKPENVLIDEHGRAKLADFGLAKVLSPADAHPSMTATQQILGTPRYIAPEQMDRPREVDHRADLYSLGVMLYEMLCGEIPAGHFQPPSQKSDSDPRLDEVVLRALAREPGRRYQNARDIRRDLLELPTHKTAVGGSKLGRFWTSPAELYYSATSIVIAIFAIWLATNWREISTVSIGGAPLCFAVSILLARINVTAAASWRELSFVQVLSTPLLLAGYLFAGSVLLFLPAALIIGIVGVVKIPAAEQDQVYLGRESPAPTVEQDDVQVSSLLTPSWLTTIGAALLATAVWALGLAAVAWRWPIVSLLFHPSGQSASRLIVIGLVVLAAVVCLPAGCAFLVAARMAA